MLRRGIRGFRVLAFSNCGVGGSRTDRQVRCTEGGGETGGLGAQILDSLRGCVEILVESDRGPSSTPGGRKKFKSCEISAPASTQLPLKSLRPHTEKALFGVEKALFGVELLIVSEAPIPYI